MKRARQRIEDSEDLACSLWGEWVRRYLVAQGYGGGVDAEFVANAIYGKPSRGVVSNPVLSELLATEHDGQEVEQRVHRHLLRYGRERSRFWLMVPWARFVGRREATSMKAIGAGPGGTIEIAEGFEVPFQPPPVEIARTWRWSGLQAWEDVAKQVGMSVRNAQVILENVKIDLGIDLRIDVMTQNGRIKPDGPPSEKERAAIIAAREARASRRRARESERA